VIPPKSNRKIQRALDKKVNEARHLIEDLLSKLKQYRAIATATVKNGAVCPVAIPSPRWTKSSAYFLTLKTVPQP
jgi:uncharacterized protein with ParB-like and HNH nuclease domain